MKRILGFCIFLTFSYIVNAQDYVVTKSNDTLYGKVKKGISTCKFISNGKKSKYKAEDISGYYLMNENLFFESVVSPEKGKKVFLLREVTGKIKLYTVTVNSSGDSRQIIKQYYISKNGSEPVEAFTDGLFNNKYRHNVIRSYIADNPVLAQEYNNLSGSIKNVFYILEKYNAQN